MLELDYQSYQKIEAEIQKKLTKASKYISGQMCARLGLRYAPEIRFYKDNSTEQINEQRSEAKQYLDDLED